MSTTDLFGGVGAAGVTVTPSLNVVTLGLNRYSGRLRSVRPALREAVDTVIRDRIESNFAREEAAGTPWAGLGTRALDERERGGYGDGPILQRRGRLKRQALMKGIWTFQGQEGFAYVSAGAFRTAPYGPFHQTGYRGQGGDVPARPFLIINAQDVEKIQQIIERYVVGRVGATVAATIL
jgi:phage gpG-like protein